MLKECSRKNFSLNKHNYCSMLVVMEGSNTEYVVCNICNWIEWYLRIWTMSWKTDFGWIYFSCNFFLYFPAIPFKMPICIYTYAACLQTYSTFILFYLFYFILKICWTSIPTTGKIRNTYFSSYFFFFLLLFKGLFVLSYESVCVCVWNELFSAWEPQHSLCFLMHAFYLVFFCCCCICIIICC